MGEFLSFIVILVSIIFLCGIYGYVLLVLGIDVLKINMRFKVFKSMFKKVEQQYPPNIINVYLDSSKIDKQDILNQIMVKTLTSSKPKQISYDIKNLKQEEE